MIDLNKNDPYERNNYVKKIEVSSKFDFLTINTQLSKIYKKIIKKFGNNLNYENAEYELINNFISDNSQKKNLIASELTIRTLYLFSFFNDKINYDKKTFNFFVHELAIKFIDLYLSHPLKKYSLSNNSFIGAWNIFIVLNIVKPNFYFESGFFQGYSTYYFDKANLKNASGFAYDIELIKEQKIMETYYSDKIKYNNFDFLEDIENINSKKGVKLFFIDDHVSHLDRLLDLQNSKIDYILFDDDWTTLTLHNAGESPIPSITTVLAMAYFNLKPLNYQINRKVILNNKIINKKITVEINKNDIEKAKKVIDKFSDFIIMPQSLARISLSDKYQILVKL